MKRMVQTLVLAAIALVATGCNKGDRVKVEKAYYGGGQKVVDGAVRCIEAATPDGDEDEDQVRVIARCYAEARESYGWIGFRRVAYSPGGFSQGESHVVPCEKAAAPEEKRVCSLAVSALSVPAEEE